MIRQRWVEIVVFVLFVLAAAVISVRCFSP